MLVMGLEISAAAFAGMTMLQATAVGAAGGFASGLVATGSIKGALRGAVFGGISAGLAYGIGGMDFSVFNDIAGFAKDIAHGVVQGGLAEAFSGEFKSGFFGAFVGHTVGRNIMPHAQQVGVVGRTAIAAVAGGTAARMGGGKFANGARNAAFAYLFSGGGVQQQGNSNGGGFLKGALDVIGKVWALPNTLVGMVYGGVGHAIGEVGYALGVYDVSPSVSFRNNAIQFENNPLMASAMTFGNVIVYGRGSDFQPGSPRGQYTLGYEEMQHTYQAQKLGPLYFPAHIVSGTTGMLMNGSWHGSSAFLEAGPHSRNPTPW